MENQKILYSRLFIIDDDVEDQEIFMEALLEVSSDIKCEGTTSGEDALKFLEGHISELPHLIFLDLNMPKLNGKQILKELKSHHQLAQIPIIMYSTSFAPRDVEEIKRLGAVHHLLKPSRFGDLCQSLAQILATRW